MRHRVYGKKLGRNKNQRQALFKSLVRELKLHGSIKTSLAKAKAASSQVSDRFSIVKLGPRLGDQTMMVKMSLTADKEPRSKK